MSHPIGELDRLRPHRPRGAARRAALVAALCGWLLLSLQAWPVGAQAAGPASPGGQLRTDAHQVRAGLQEDARRLQRGVRRDSHALGRQFRRAGDQMRADVHRLGHGLRAWWGRMRARLAGARDPRARAGPRLRQA